MPSTCPIAAATAIALWCHWQDASYSSPLLHAAHSRGTEVPAFTLCSLLTPCLTLGVHLKEIILNQAASRATTAFAVTCPHSKDTERLVALAGQLQSTLITTQRAMSRALGMAWTRQLWPRSRGPPWVLVTPWRGVGGNVAYSRGPIKSFVTKLS